MLPIYLSAKEIWRNKSRFISVSLVIALITLLVLFITALGEGLALAGKEYLENLNEEAEILIFQENVDISIPSSRLGRSRLNDLSRVDGVEAVGPIGFSIASILTNGGADNIDVSLIGVEPGLPGEPPVIAGLPLQSRRANEIIIDENILDSVDIAVGEQVQLSVVQGTREEIYTLTVVGHTAGQTYNFLPGVFVPLLTWDKIKPSNGATDNTELSYNVAAIKVAPGQDWEALAPIIEAEVNGVEVSDPVTAYENGPGYAAQQSTINTQKSFIILIATLVIGGFFQIQTLQKVGQVGMLKAIGASNLLVSISLLMQVTMTTLIGVGIGSAAAFGLSLALPAGTPIVFEGPSILLSLFLLIAIGPLSGLISMRTLFKVEPLTALGLGG
ncbi:MAG: ABC transporter permease [Chloroflexota bacterium]